MSNYLNRMYLFFLQLCSRGQGSTRRVDYIGGSEVLPPPLSGDEERTMLERMAQQDPEARQSLIEHNLPFIHATRGHPARFAVWKDTASIGRCPRQLRFLTGI